MNVRFDYCCKNCWYTWKSIKKMFYCPKCKSKNMDIQREVVI